MRYSIILAVSILLFVPAFAFSATLKVPSQYPKIQDAIEAAVKGDTVLVQPGTYVENIDFKGKAITVTSEHGQDVTVIDGNQAGLSVVTCQSGEGLDTVLDGFTITNGKFGNGGGMYNYDHCSPTVMNCIFSGNSANSGGGMYNGLNSNPKVINCTFSGNSVSTGFDDSYGGGMYTGYINKPTVTNCTFFENSATSSYSNSAGGGMCIGYNSKPTVTNCSFAGNSAGRGGGMMNDDQSNAIVTNCTFMGNTADYWGGGMSNVGASPTVNNTIFWKNSASEGPEIWIGYSSYPSTLTISYSDVKGGKSSIHIEPNCTLNWGPGMINSDPLFVDEANGDYHLTFNSPCRGSGDNSVITEFTDFEGDPRIAYGTVDMGADEFYTHLYWTGDATPGGIVEFKFVGLPGTSPVLLFISTGVLDPPIKSMWGDWYLAYPFLGPFDMGKIPYPEGILILKGQINSVPPPPYSFAMQAGIGSELTNLCIFEVK